MKEKALFMVLSDKVENKNFVLLENLEAKEFKTKIMNEMINKLEGNKAHLAGSGQARKQESKKAKRSVLVINEKKDEKAKYSFRNLEGVKIINLDNINILDLLKYRKLIMTKAGVKIMEKRKE